VSDLGKTQNCYLRPAVEELRMPRSSVGSVNRSDVSRTPPGVPSTSPQTMLCFHGGARHPQSKQRRTFFLVHRSQAFSIFSLSLPLLFSFRHSSPGEGLHCLFTGPRRRVGGNSSASYRGPNSRSLPGDRLRRKRLPLCQVLRHRVLQFTEKHGSEVTVLRLTEVTHSSLVFDEK
jgi:hypothetical protein